MAILTSCGKLETKVLRIIRIGLIIFMSRMILKIRKQRLTVSTSLRELITPAAEPRQTMRSKAFHESSVAKFIFDTAESESSKN